MSIKNRVPELKNPNIVVRLATTAEEINQANTLICQNYLAVGLFDDEAAFWGNKYVHSPARVPIVAINDKQVVGTVSIIKDSNKGLPADNFQAPVMKQLRKGGETLAESSALSVDASQDQHSLVLFLLKFMFQYGFYYGGIDRFLATVVPKHSLFYRNIFKFQKLSDPSSYNYVKLNVQLLTLGFQQAHEDLYNYYGKDRESNFYRFIMIDDHPALQLPSEDALCRPKDARWSRNAA